MGEAYDEYEFDVYNQGVDLVVFSLFALTLGIQQNMKYIIILDISTISLFREKSLAVKHSIGHR